MLNKKAKNKFCRHTDKHFFFLMVSGSWKIQDLGIVYNNILTKNFRRKWEKKDED